MEMENLRELLNGDEQRLNVLMAALPGSRDINQVQWDTAIEFWNARIVNYCRANKRVCFTTSEIFNHFEIGDKKPWCLPDVVSELMRLGSVNDRVTLNAKFSWRSWAVKHFVWNPIGFMASAKSYLPLQSSSQGVGKPQLPSSLMSQHLFIPSLIEEFSFSLKPQLEGTDSFECLYTADEFHVKFLSSISCPFTKQYIIETWKAKGVIKHAVLKGQEMFKLGESAISEHDANILQIKVSIKSFEEKLESRERDHDEMMAKVKKSLKMENKNEARRLLRQAKVIREDIGKLRMALDRLQETKNTIETAALNIQFLGAVKSGTDALKSISTPKRVTEASQIMDDIDEQTSIANELTAALSTPLSSQCDVADLEAELASLILSDKKEKAKNKPATSSLSSVSNHIPELPATPKGIPQKHQSSQPAVAESPLPAS